MTPQELKYLETSLTTAPKEELILRVYDALIMFARQAVDRLYNDAGDIQTNLNLVYAYWHRELVRANMEQDPTRIEKILPDIIDYRQTWMDAIKEWRRQQSNGEASTGSDFAATA